MTDWRDLDQLLHGLAVNLSPSERARMSRASAQALRKANAQRIKRQLDADGNAFAPRLKDKHGQIRTKAKLFAKLRQARHLKARGNADGFEVGFLTPRDARIASVHHYGLTDRVERGRDFRVKYAKRTLLGFSAADETAIIDAVAGKLDL